MSDAWELFYKEECQEDKVEKNLNIIMARTQTLFQELKPQLKRKMKDEKIHELQKDITTKNKAKLELLRDMLYDYLDDIRLTRIDTQAKYDRTMLEKDNENAGL